MSESTTALKVDGMRKMLLIPRCVACAEELHRSAEVLRGSGLTDAAEGTQLMSETMALAADSISNQARIAERLAVSARFLLDMLQASNEEVEAMYGRTDTLEQAAIELRLAVKEHEESK